MRKHVISGLLALLFLLALPLSAAAAHAVVTVEEHAAWGGLYAAVSSVLSSRMPRRVVGLTLPDAPVPAGSSAEVFRFLGLDADGIFETARRALEE